MKNDVILAALINFLVPMVFSLSSQIVEKKEKLGDPNNRTSQVVFEWSIMVCYSNEHMLSQTILITD